MGKTRLGIVVLIFFLTGCGNLVTRTMVMQGASMQPTIKSGQQINIVPADLSRVQRGNIVALRSPLKDATDLLVKRVIGLPNETVEIRQGRVYINGTLLDEPYIAQFCDRTTCDGKWIDGSGDYFILGDNRNNSYDSHSFGPLKGDLILYAVV